MKIAKVAFALLALLVLVEPGYRIYRWARHHGGDTTAFDLYAVGGSTMAGVPYASGPSSRFSTPRIIARMFNEEIGGRPIAVHNLAEQGHSIYPQWVALARTVEHRDPRVPGAVLIYTGENEGFGPGSEDPPESGLRAWMETTLVPRSPLVRDVMFELARKDVLRRRRSFDNFERYLRRTVETARAAGLTPILGPFVSNIAGVEPNCSDGQDPAGLLCLGFDRAEACDADTLDNARGFADRLAVVLANVAYDQRLYHQANYDSLTELPNRQLFRERLDAQLGPALTAGGALLYIDLDHFKRVNDTAGHGAGDELLRIVARRIGSLIKAEDTVARLGGDEFAVVLAGDGAPQAASEVANRIIHSLQQPIEIGTRTFRVGASVGITLFPQDGRTLEELLKNGDLAMYRAKEQGRNRAMFYEPDMQARVTAHSARIAALHQAVRERQFALHYQPIVSARDGRITGAEALMRWYANGVQYCGPDDFIPVAEETGLIVEMGRWALQESCRQLAVWRGQGLSLAYVSVNVSARQLHDDAFVDMVTGLLQEYQLPPSALQLVRHTLPAHGYSPHSSSLG